MRRTGLSISEWQEPTSSIAVLGCSAIFSLDYEGRTTWLVPGDLSARLAATGVAGYLSQAVYRVRDVRGRGVQGLLWCEPTSQEELPGLVMLTRGIPSQSQSTISRYAVQRTLAALP